MNRSWPRAGVFLLGIMVMATIRSQDLSTDLVESVLQESGSVWSEELLQILQDELPFDLNDSLARDRMLVVGVFDAAQHRALEDHIRRYGPLLNVYELGVMDAFSALWIAQWLSWVHCGSSRKAGAGRWKGRAEQSLRFRSMLSESEAGGGWRSATRMTLKHSYGHQLRVVIASGEGEPWLRPASATGPEWISGALVVRPGNTIRQLIMGDLRMQGGYGLRYGAGWSSWDGHYPLSVPFKPYRIMAAASSLEGNCLRGIAAESRLGAWRITTLAARQVSDGSLGQGESGLDWSDGPAGDHSKPGHQAIRGRSETGRYGLRLGSEKERGRFGLSLDAISVNTVPVDTLSLPIEYQDACLGADLQYHGPRSELGVEAAAWASGPMGIGLGFTLFPEGWIGVRIQWMLANGRLPLPEQFTNLAEASIFRESRTVSSYLRWGRGWELSFGIGQCAGYKPGAMDLYREERLYLLLNYVEGNVHGLRITLSAKAKEEDNFPGQARAHNTSLRCLWDRTIIPGLRLEGGHQLSLSRNAGPMVSGMGLWSGLRSGIDYGLLQALRFDLAFHASRDADTRTYFWVSGPEGRIVMQTLYYDGWKANVSGDLRIGKAMTLSTGVGISTSYRDGRWRGRSFEAGFRLGFSPLVF